jgi:large subunit ribosomal protein L17
MRHAKSGRKLGRSMSHRKALMRNLATSLLTYGRIRTTFIKAKELQMVADRLVTLAKRGDLHARRQAISMVYDDQVVSRLFSDIAPWYKERQGGYTRILKLEPRPGDNSPMAFIEFVDRKELGEIKQVVKPKKKFKKSGANKPAPKAKAEKGQAVKPKAEAKPAVKAVAKPKAPAAKKPVAKKKEDK